MFYLGLNWGLRFTKLATKWKGHRGSCPHAHTGSFAIYLQTDGRYACMTCERSWVMGQFALFS